MAPEEVSGLEPELEIIDLTGETSEDGEGQYGDEELDDPSSDGPDEASAQLLRRAIYALPEARLRHVVAGLADTVPAVYRALARELVAVSPEMRVVIPRWETCANCGETYDVNADEGDEECTFHPGSCSSCSILLRGLTGASGRGPGSRRSKISGLGRGLPWAHGLAEQPGRIPRKLRLDLLQRRRNVSGLHYRETHCGRAQETPALSLVYLRRCFTFG